MDVSKLKTNVKKFFSNPNTLTFILVIGLIVVIYLVYSYMINRAIAPVNVPYCTNELKTMTEITSESVGSVQISGNFVTASGSSLLQNQRSILHKVVAPGYLVPKNSFFYSDAVADSSITDKTLHSDIADETTLYALETDFHATYGCSIMPGNYIDLYFKANDPNDDGKLIFKPFITSIQVLKVIDKNGVDVFTESTKAEPDPDKIVFNVTIEQQELLVKAEHIKKYKIEIIPVPRNAGYSENHGEQQIDPSIQGLINDNASTME